MQNPYPVPKDVAMALFWLSMSYDFRCIIVSDTLFHSVRAGFRGQAIRRRHSRFRGSNGRCHGNHFGATVCKTVGPTPPDRRLSVVSLCLSCLSVTLVYCGQTVGWIKMKLGTEVGLGSGHIVLDRDPVPPSPKGTAPVFGPNLL